jgi:hypothetical protein
MVHIRNLENKRTRSGSDAQVIMTKVVRLSRRSNVDRLRDENDLVNHITKSLARVRLLPIRSDCVVEARWLPGKSGHDPAKHPTYLPGCWTDRNRVVPSGMNQGPVLDRLAFEVAVNS